MGPILDPGGPLCRASLPISPGGPIGLFEVLSLGVMLPPTPFPFLPSTGRCDGGVPVLSAYKYRFPVVFSKSSSGYLSLLFPLLAAHCKLPFFLKSLQPSVLYPRLPFGLSPPRNHLCSVRPYGETWAGLLWSGTREGLETGQKRHRRRPSPHIARTWNQDSIRFCHPSLDRVCPVSLRPSRVPLLPFLMYDPLSDIVITDTQPLRQLLCRI
jgi:hypothetical protein